MQERIRPPDADLVEGPASPEQPEALRTVRLDPQQHAVSEFCCARSARVEGFIRTQAAQWIEQDYCKVFVIPDPDAPSRILGYYTLSPSLLIRDELSSQHQKRVIGGIPVPLIRVGFMGRDDSAERGLGAALIIDAARRVYRNEDIAAWGLVLDSEGGEDNPTLMSWYEKVGFRKAKKAPGVMYGPWKNWKDFLP